MAGCHGQNLSTMRKQGLLWTRASSMEINGLDYSILFTMYNKERYITEVENFFVHVFVKAVSLVTSFPMIETQVVSIKIIIKHIFNSTDFHQEETVFKQFYSLCFELKAPSFTSWDVDVMS